MPHAYSSRIDGLPIGADAGSCGAAAYLDRPVVAEDIGTDPRWREYRAIATPHGLRSCWSSPIRGRQGVLGTFAVYHDHRHRPSAREERLVDRLTHLASVAIEHAGLFGALAESEERFRRAFADNATGMALADPHGRITDANRALTELLGRDITGERVDEVLVPCAGAAGEARARHAGGAELELAVTSSPVHGPDGGVVQLSVAVLDLTQRRAALRERQARHEAEVARAAAESASRAKSRFVAALGHELRTPLQAISGFAELLGTLDLPADRRAGALDRIAGATSHILSLVDEVLDVARVEAGALPVHPERVDAAALTDEVLDLLGPVAGERGVTLHHVPGGAADVLADPRRLRQVLINLVGNGIRYNRPDGWVTVGIDGGGAGVRLVVRDSGRGIPEHVTGRIFVAFDRLDLAEHGPADQGIGLGLPLARGLVEAMGGTLTISSVVDAGTTAVVALPRVEPPLR
ncbi:ATP-binding protein [Pseudonocardia sp. Ae150A_Ps1]|uniref:GAF domain-containing sensor histidine kinase n=1 Tax=unclassified Pseudonocardia TaxID=2619320 RepID=UPI0032C45492